MASEDDHTRSKCCFLEWMAIQEQDLTELVDNRTRTENSKPEPILPGRAHTKGHDPFRKDMKKRAQLDQIDVSAFFDPAWNFSLENSLLWIAGCRPTVYARLIYALCGSEVNSHQEEFLRGDRSSMKNLGDLTSRQMQQMDELRGRTFKEEEKLHSRLARVLLM